MNKKNLISYPVSLLLLIVTSGCSSMIVPPIGFQEDAIPRTNSEKSLSAVFKISHDEKSQPYIRIYYNIPYSGITFVKNDSVFNASFRLNINIKHEEEKIVNKNITEILRTNDYSKTVSSAESFFGTFKENIYTGKNEVLLMLMDKNSERRYFWKREIFVPEAPDTLRQD